jgi:hypothetical protein
METMNGRRITILRKIARVWSVVIIGLGVLLFLAEIFEAQTAELEPYPWFENLIPVTLFLSVVGLAVAWKWEGIGGGMAVGFAVVNILIYLATGRSRVAAVALVLAPVVLPGLLFLTCWRASKKTISPDDPGRVA